MNRKVVLRILVIIFFVFFLGGLYVFNPSTKSISLPEKVYAVYRIDKEEATDNSCLKIVTVNYDGEIRIGFSRSYSPITALIDMGYQISNRNKVTSTSPISDLYNRTYILVETYRTTIDEIVIEIPYGTVIQGTVLCESLSEETTEQDGVLGLMTQKIKKVYRGDTLIAEEVIDENIIRNAIPEIIIIEGPDDSPSSVPQRGYNCPYWNAYVDSINATDEEKQWLKFVMNMESGCNAESNISFYKGLFQWNPCLWYKQYPNDNIFDGEAQIRRTLEKLRDGANPNQMWPAVHQQYKNIYGELSWLQ